jgi:hypothetical protein
MTRPGPPAHRGLNPDRAATNGSRGENEEEIMPKYLIRREVPGAGGQTADQLHDQSAKYNAVLAQRGTGVHGVQTYDTGDRLVCVYNADNEERIHEHARVGGFPCDEITEVTGIIDPVTGED